MSTTTVIEPPTRSAVHDVPTVGEMLGEILPLIGVVVVAGPPGRLLAGPLVLGTLTLVGPFALAVTAVLAGVVVRVAAAALVALVGAIVVAPYLLVHRLHAHRRGGVRLGVSAGQLVAVGSRQGAP